MFKVQLIEAGEAFSEQTLFRTNNIEQAWNVYIDRVLTTEVASETSLKGIFVVDKIGTYIDPPEYIWLRIKAAREEQRAVQV